MAGFSSTTLQYIERHWIDSFVALEVVCTNISMRSKSFERLLSPALNSAIECLSLLLLFPTQVYVWIPCWMQLTFRHHHQPHVGGTCSHGCLILLKKMGSFRVQGDCDMFRLYGTILIYDFVPPIHLPIVKTHLPKPFVTSIRVMGMRH